MSLLQQALAWAERGFPVFPLQPRSKVPFTGSRGCKEASTNAATIRDWWHRTPDANIGIATGAGFFVVDLDGQEAAAWWKECCARNGGLDRTLTIQTKKGWHLFFRSQAPPPNSASRLATHVDVRGVGGYVVGAPSVHPEGCVYAVRRDLPAIEAPGWLIDLAKPPEPPAFVPSTPPLHGEGSRLRSVEGVIACVATARPGERNRMTYWAACRLLERASEGLITHRLAEELLVEAGRRTGLACHEIIRTMRSAERASL
jgi:hypothetical protein